MKCTVEKEALLTHLQKVCNIVSRRPVLPILNNVRLEAEDNILNLKATDLEITIRTELRADVEYSGVTTLPAKSLLALVSKLKGDKIEIDCGDNHHAAIKCGSAEFLLKGLDPVDFPDDPLFESKRKIRLTQPELGRMIDYVSYAVSQDSSRKTLQGILFSVKGSILTTVATDGKCAGLPRGIPQRLAEGRFRGRLADRCGAEAALRHAAADRAAGSARIRHRGDPGGARKSRRVFGYRGPAAAAPVAADRPARLYGRDALPDRDDAERARLLPGVPENLRFPAEGVPPRVPHRFPRRRSESEPGAVFGPLPEVFRQVSLRGAHRREDTCREASPDQHRFHRQGDFRHVRLAGSVLFLASVQGEMRRFSPRFPAALQPLRQISGFLPAERPACGIAAVPDIA